MNVLLDTHVVLWFFAGDPRLPRKYRKLIIEQGHEQYFSAASTAEISTKFVTGKLNLPQAPIKMIPEMMQELRLIPLSITVEHGLAVADLPLHHRDPFDRLLIAQARHERIPILTGDKLIRQYDVQVIW